MRTLLLLAVLFSSSALASGWSDFEAAFPLHPCPDGWVACRVADEGIDPDLRQDGPSDMRIGWFDLQPTALFSPLKATDPYPLTPPAKPPEPPASDPPVRVPPPARDRADDLPPPSQGQQVASHPPAIGIELPADPPITVDPPVDDGDGLTKLNAPVPAVTCDDLVSMELAAMVGKLTPEQIGCLEASYAATSKQTDKGKISRVLIGNAYAKDRREWARLVERHLDEVEQSDPNMTYAYAGWCLKQRRYEAAIRWADVALERRDEWSGHTYTTRVLALYKMRAEAAHALWDAAEQRHAASPSDPSSADVETTRGRAKALSREWYDFSEAAGQDSTLALTLCTSAAGTAEFCAGG